MLALWLADLHNKAMAAEDASGVAHDAAELAQHAGDAAHHAPGIPELPNIFGVIHHVLAVKAPGTADFLDNFAAHTLGISDPMVTPFQAFENLLFAALVIIGLSWFFISCNRCLRKDPPKNGKLAKRAMFVEVVVLFFDDFFGQIFGRQESRKHLPFVGTLFIYILVLNTLGLIWLGKSPTSNLSFNLGLALIVFFYVHITGISRSPFGYIKHYPGEIPSLKELGPIGLFIIPFVFILNIVIHIMEAIIQPVSLSLRLFGNILGKEVLLGVFGGLLVIGGGAAWGGIAIPLHTPFLFLGLLLGTIQALIFSLLSAVYITLWMPHDHGHEHAHAESH